jgi:flagellar basal body rod protein FlgB
MKVIFGFLLIFGFSGTLFAQAIAPSVFFDQVIFDDTSKLMEGAILDTGKRQAIYAYNLANASTPGFEPILMADDRAALARIMPPGEDYTSKVIIEHMMAKMSENSRKQSGYMALYKKKFDNWRQVVTLGKR